MKKLILFSSTFWFILGLTLCNASCNSTSIPYYVVWSDLIKNGGELRYNITELGISGPSWMKINDSLYITIEKLPNEVEYGCTGNGYYYVSTISEQLDPLNLPPFFIPSKVFRSCCSAYKEITYQLSHGGWGNFSLDKEDINSFIVDYYFNNQRVSINFSIDGIALTIKVYTPIKYNENLLNYTLALIPTFRDSTSPQNITITLSPFGVSLGIIFLHFKKKFFK